MLRWDLAEAHFVTERLAARAFRPAIDAREALEIYGDPAVVRYIGNQLITDLSAMEQRLQAIVARNEKWPRGFGAWAVFARETGGMVGTALLKPLPASGTGRQDSDDIEVGWHLGRRDWGRGFATEMGRALLMLGFEGLGVPELHAVVDTPNFRSLRVAQRIGLRHRGTTDRYYDLTLEHFSLRREDWIHPRGAAPRTGAHGVRGAR